MEYERSFDIIVLHEELFQWKPQLINEVLVCFASVPDPKPDFDQNIQPFSRECNFANFSHLGLCKTGEPEVGKNRCIRVRKAVSFTQML